MLTLALDTIMFGCAIALFWDEPQFHGAINKLLRADMRCGCSILYVLIAPICLSVSRPDMTGLLIGYPLRGLLISIVMLYVVCKPASRMGYALISLYPAFGSHLVSSSSLAADVHCRDILVAFPRFVCGSCCLAPKGSSLVVVPEWPFCETRDWIEDRVPGLRAAFERGATGVLD